MKTRTKYGSRVTYLDGIRFASVREAARYRELFLLQAAGEIHDLEFQVAFPLRAAISGEVVGKYVADFTYRDRDDELHVEDAKGVRTQLYVWKKRHFELEYGQVLEEV